MALYLKGNRILSEEEHNNEELGKGCGALMVLFLAVLFVLSPGIVITSLLDLMINFTPEQLWGSAIVGSIVVAIILVYVWGTENFVTSYLCTAAICAVFMFLVYLMTPDNCFYSTLKTMLGQ